jgi:hypothetical protein
MILLFYTAERDGATGTVGRGNVPRYYFNIITPGGPLVDFEGTELSNLDHARQEAIKDARALMSTAMINGQTIFGRRIEIRNEAGDLLLVVPFTDAVKATG